jgi:hypothetical protein
MAKIQLENIREHDLTISGLNEAGELVQVSIPAARLSNGGTGDIIKGVAEADDAFVEAMRKKSPVVAHFFGEGWLTVAKTETGKAKAKAAAE